MSLNILYEDNHMLAVVKPAGLLIAEDKTKAPFLLEEVRYYLKTKYNKLGNVFVGMVHRLDRNVSGIVLVAKTSKGASRLSEQIRKHSIEKIYTAVVQGILTQEKDLTHYLIKDEEFNATTVFDTQVPESQIATLTVTPLSHTKTHTLVRVKLGTGRSHQIRAQLSHIGHPIVGDFKYGNREELSDGSIALCATEVSFDQVVTGERITVKIEVPENWHSSGLIS